MVVAKLCYYLLYSQLLSQSGKHTHEPLLCDGCSHVMLYSGV